MANNQEELNTKALLELAESPSLFSATLLGFIPFQYQRNFMEETSKRIAVCAGRQVGKSTMAASKAIWFAISRPKTTTLIVSATLRQSMNLFEKIVEFSHHSSLISKSIKKGTRRQLTFSNRSRIIALPCGPDGNSLRGYTADLVVVDEAAFVPDDVISKVIFPMLSTTSGTAMLLSTPWDRDHIFYRAFNSENWARFHFPSSANPLVTKEFLDEQRELYGEQRFSQEYLAEFRDDGRAYFPMSLLRTCLHICSSSSCNFCDSFSGNAPVRSENLFGGYDPGGMQDPAAFVVVDRVKGEFRVLRSLTYLARNASHESPYTSFTMRISELHKKMPLRRVLVDSTGLGAPILELCKEIGLPASEMKITQGTKEEIFFNLKMLLEKRKIILPNEPSLLASLNCVEAEKTRTGGYSFSHPPGSHDDLAFALALALWIGGRGSPVVAIMKKQEQGSSWREDLDGRRV